MFGTEVAVHALDGVRLDATILDDGISKHWAILAHGITVDKDEEGAFVRMGEDLLKLGVNSIRFSFRGHGSSGCPSEGMTISGEMLDLASVLDFVVSKTKTKPILISASFGAVSSCLLGEYIEPRIAAAVFWNPVIDLNATFFNSNLTWAKKNFQGRNILDVYKNGFFYIDETFKVSHIFWRELHQFNPSAELLKTNFPLLIIHGDQDTYVPYSVSLELAGRRPNSSIVKIIGSDHGFSEPKYESEARAATVAFVKSQLSN